MKTTETIYVQRNIESTSTTPVKLKNMIEDTNISEMNEFKYFLNSMKDTMPFDSEKDFQKKIKENRELEIYNN